MSETTENAPLELPKELPTELPTELPVEPIDPFHPQHVTKDRVALEEGVDDGPIILGTDYEAAAEENQSNPPNIPQLELEIDSVSPGTIRDIDADEDYKPYTSVEIDFNASYAVDDLVKRIYEVDGLANSKINDAVNVLREKIADAVGVIRYYEDE